jgi:hypothetical protein
MVGVPCIFIDQLMGFRTSYVGPKQTADVFMTLVKCLFTMSPLA